MAGERVGDFIECPKCGYIDRDTAEYELYEDDATTEADCGRCDATFRVRLSLRATYATSLVAPASAPPQPAAPRGHEVFCALPPDHVGGCIDAFGGALPKRAAQAEGETCPECANLGTRTFGGGPCSKGCSARRSGKGEGGR